MLRTILHKSNPIPPKSHLHLLSIVNIFLDLCAFVSTNHNTVQLLLALAQVLPSLRASMISLDLLSLSIGCCSWVVWQMVWKFQELEIFRGHLKHVTIQRCKLSLLGIKYFKEEQCYSVLCAYSTNKMALKGTIDRDD